MEFRNIRTDSLINGGEEWESNTSSRSEMPVRTVSQKFSHPLWGRHFEELWGRPTTTADLRSSFWQIPHTTHVCLLEDKIQDRGMYFFTISYGSYAVDQRSGVVDSVDDLKSSSSVRGIRMPDFEVLDARIASALNEKNHPENPLQEKGQSGGNESPKRGPLSPRKTDRLLDLRVLPGHWSQLFCQELCRPIYSCSSKWWCSGIRFKMVRNSIINDENPIWWHLGRIVQIKNTRVWETQDRIGIVWPGDSSEENRTWLSQIENNGEKKYRARFAK